MVELPGGNRSPLGDRGAAGCAGPSRAPGARGVTLSRRPSSALAEGIVTHLQRSPVGVGLALAQHDRGARLLADHSWTAVDVDGGEPHPGGTPLGLAELVDAEPLPSLRRPPEEAGAHVVPLAAGVVLLAASAPKTAEWLDDIGFDVVSTDIDEFEKLEGCVTCLSVLVPGAVAP